MGFFEWLFTEKKVEPKIEEPKLTLNQEVELYEKHKEAQKQVCQSQVDEFLKSDQDKYYLLIKTSMGDFKSSVITAKGFVEYHTGYDNYYYPHYETDEQRDRRWKMPRYHFYGQQTSSIDNAKNEAYQVANCSVYYHEESMTYIPHKDINLVKIIKIEE